MAAAAAPTVRPCLWDGRGLGAGDLTVAPCVRPCLWDTRASLFPVCLCLQATALAHSPLFMGCAPCSRALSCMVQRAGAPGFDSRRKPSGDDVPDPIKRDPHRAHHHRWRLGPQLGPRIEAPNWGPKRHAAKAHTFYAYGRWGPQMGPPATTNPAMVRSGPALRAPIGALPGSTSAVTKGASHKQGHDGTPPHSVAVSHTHGSPSRKTCHVTI